MGKYWYTVTEVCDLMGVTRSTFNKWKAKGEAPRAIRLPNGTLRVEVDDFDAWRAALPEAA